jgi:hypothetical protein
MRWMSAPGASGTTTVSAAAGPAVAATAVSATSEMRVRVSMVLWWLRHGVAGWRPLGGETFVRGESHDRRAVVHGETTALAQSLNQV